MLQRVLVANRGEIARRIQRTCRRLGIETVAVFSEPDRNEPHATEADHSVAIGGATATESYLRVDAILDAAKRTGADSVHPGYGFLAESADFARAVTDAGLIWVGPSPEVMETMGSKLASKRIAAEAGVSTMVTVEIGDGGSAAASLGFPLLLKADAGGGGKGMRVVEEAADLDDAIAASRGEAMRAFGDGTVFAEKYLRAPRHVEVQILGDTHGTVVALPERDCSIQRRHQKIIEETPSPDVDANLRTALSDSAIAIARLVGYVGAGTVEFLLSGSDFYFLEMNTRLQVEHPITEMVTGLDLVEIQMAVAAGEPLPVRAEAAFAAGHAVEARVYAEDPGNDFLPVAGEIHRFEFAPIEGVRVDSGVEAGSAASIHYDPLLAKVVAHGPNRNVAVRRLALALRSAHIHAGTTNRSLLVRILEHPQYLSGEFDTAFLERHDPADLSAPLLDTAAERRAAIAAALAGQEQRRAEARVLPSIPSGWRNSPSQPQVARYTGESGDHEVRYRFTDTGLEVEGEGMIRLGECTPDLVDLEIESLRAVYAVHSVGEVVYVDGPEGPARLVEVSRFRSADAEERAGSLHAPMPGRVIKVAVAEGDEVAEGAVLMVIEAMKMEHALRAPYSGRVSSLKASEGDQVVAAAVLVVVEQE